MRLTPLVLFLLVAACGGESVTPLVVQIVTASGTDPFADGGVSHVHVDVREGTATPVSVDEDTTASAWSHDVQITDIAVPAQTRVTLTTPGGTLIGAAPDFVPQEATFVVRLPVGPPLTCGAVAGGELATARARPSAVLIDAHSTFPLVAGEGTALEVLDLLALAATSGGADVLQASDVRLVMLGAGALALSTTSDAAERYVFATDATMRQTAVTVHAGASGGTPLSLQADGAVVIGGTASSDVTFVGVDGASSLSPNPLTAARRAPSALLLSDGRVLVAGGGAPTAPVAEIVARARATTVIAGTDGVRDGAALFTDGHSVLLVGGVDATGTPRTDTVLFTGCPDACVVTPGGPPFPDARADATPLTLPATISGAGGLLVGGRLPSGPSRLVTRVRFDAAGIPHIDTQPLLASPRAAPAAFALPSGLVYVLEGLGADGTPRNDVEVCFPEQLAPL